VGKLVLFLADGSTLDIRLERERITIGRRADNDVCMPYPAVSGEHAALVTILADSFLEDLGSTNGTLVNGKPIAKHFLRDRDQIDIGRQKLVYVADEAVKLDPTPQSLGRLDMQVFGERVEPARPPPTVVVPPAGSADAARLSDPPPPPSIRPGGSSSEFERFIATEIGSVRHGKESIDAQPVVQKDHVRLLPPEAAADPIPAIRVLTGPNTGREVVLRKDDTVVGRVGLQVAAVRRSDDGFRLVPVEGNAPPSVNGAPVGSEGQPLQVGDVVEIAGVKLELVAPIRGEAA
jgi:pSer/pThr/pTyr-binding forkhead associated (FHA) protein